MNNHSHQVTLHLTDDCNLRCSYCFLEDKRPLSMPISIARQSMDWAVRADTKRVKITFFGGEPLLCMDLIREIVDYGRFLEKTTGKQIRYGMTSNGTLFSEDTLDFFNEHQIGFHFSLDGAPETQDRFRRTRSGKPTSPILEEKMPLILRLHHRPSVRMTVTPETADKLYDNVCYVLGYGFRNIAPVVVQEADWNGAALAVLRDSWERVAALFMEHQLRGDPVNLKHLCDGMDFLEKQRRKKHLCGAGRNMISIDPKGDIFPCHRFVANDKLIAYKMGHIDRIDELDVSQFLQLTVEKMTGCKTRGTGLNTDKCSDCQLAFHCTGGCIAVNATHHGSMYRPEPNNATLQALYLDIARRTSIALEQYAS